MLNTNTSKTQIITSIDTAPIEGAFEEACFDNFHITHRLELRRLVTSLWFDAEMKKQGGPNQNHLEPLRALTNFKANLQRRKTTSDSLTSSRLMEVPKPARAILITDIAYTLTLLQFTKKRSQTLFRL